jgi:hypothetical protein
MYTSKFKILFSIILILNYTIASDDLAKGSDCTLKSGLSGICQSIYDCQETFNKLRNGLIRSEQITICNEQMRYVCCPRYVRGEMSEKSK